MDEQVLSPSISVFQSKLRRFTQAFQSLIEEADCKLENIEDNHPQIEIYELPKSHLLRHLRQFS